MAYNNLLPTKQEGIVPQNYTILPTKIEAYNKTTLLAPSVNEALYQSTPTAELRAPAPNKTML